MNGSRANYVIVGGFVLAMIVGLIVTLAWVTGWTRQTDRYVTVFRNVTGITHGTKVLYEGFPVGRVIDLRRLSPGETEALIGSEGMKAATLFRVDLEVKKGWPIADQSEAEIVAPGLLAAVSVNIAERPPALSYRQTSLDGTRVIVGRDAETIWRKAETLVDTLKPLATAVENTLTQRIDPTFAELLDLAAYLRERLPPIVAGVEQFTETVNETAKSLGATADDLRLVLRQENRDHVDRLLANLDRASSDLTRLTAKTDHLVTSLSAMVDANRADIDQSISSLRYVLGALARDIDSINRNIEGTARNMNEFSRQIRQNPGRLLGGTTASEPAHRRAGER